METKAWTGFASAKRRNTKLAATVCAGQPPRAEGFRVQGHFFGDAAAMFRVGRRQVATRWPRGSFAIPRVSCAPKPNNERTGARRKIGQAGPLVLADPVRGEVYRIY